jgi:hypothetical protein
MIRPIPLIALFALLLSVASCVPLPKSEEPGAKRIVEPDDDTLREHAGEIGRLYGRLKILSLDDIPEERYAEYKRYVNNGAAYVIVHPSYYLFFHNYNKKKVVVERPRWNFSKNTVDIFIDEYPAGKSKILNYMKEMERRERDFLKKASARERLVILVLPPDYLNHPEYPYRKLDEFARYINEATGGSPSVIYLDSESHKRGFLTFDTAPRLNRFLKAAEVKTLLLGGGYVDLCLKDFYESALNLKDIEKVEIVQELSVDSPDYLREERSQ